jgi:hypothetical protein
MVSAFKISRLLTLVAFLAPPISGWSDEVVVRQLSAQQIDAGCSLRFVALESNRPAIGRPDYSLDLRWLCDDRPVQTIDTYEIEGSSPEPVTVLYRKRRDIVILVKWSPRSHAADAQGDFYKVYAYTYARQNHRSQFSLNRRIMRTLGEGWEGTLDGRPVHFRYKDATSIRKGLDRFGY